MNLRDKGIIIQKVTESDLHQIYTAGLNEPLFSDTNLSFNPENLTNVFAADNAIIFAASRKKKVLGFIIGLIKDNECRIQWLLVKETYRKAGIGTELLHFLMENAKKKGVNNFFIAVFNNNSDSVNFFNHKGFTVNKTCMELYRKSDEKF
jgi:ribosomal protein S18 acetylase RimI-like enzyme